MARPGSPLRPHWQVDPALAASVDGPDPAADSVPPHRATAQDEVDLRADLAARRRLGDGRRARAPQPGALAPGRALAGAAVAVAGVCLGLGTLLWVSDDPSLGPGPVVVQAVSEEAGDADPLEPSPVAPSPVVPSPVSTSPSPIAQAVAGVVPVTVLNNSKRSGLALRAAQRFVDGGWPVTRTGNFRGQIPVTTVYYDPGLQASAEAFAAAFDGIIRVRPSFDTLPASGVVVVLTREFAA